MLRHMQEMYKKLEHRLKFRLRYPHVRYHINMTVSAMEQLRRLSKLYGIPMADVVELAIRKLHKEAHNREYYYFVTKRKKKIEELATWLDDDEE